MTSEIGAHPQPTLDDVAIYALRGVAGTQLLAEHPGSERFIGYTYGAFESGQSVPEDDGTSWRWEMARVALGDLTVDAPPSKMVMYGDMIMGLATTHHRAHVAERTDSLSGLPNRLGFYDELEYAIKWVTGKLGAAKVSPDGTQVPAETTRGLDVGAIDIDHFKDINDVLGYAVGDRVITMLGDCLREATRLALEERKTPDGDAEQPQEHRAPERAHYPDWDFVARDGGDEFKMIRRAHDMVDEEGALILSAHDILVMTRKRIEAAVAEEMVKINTYIFEEAEQQGMLRDGRSPVPEVRASFGWHLFREDDSEAIVRRETNIALHREKHDGKTAEAEEDRMKLTTGERRRVLNIIKLFDTSKFVRYRRAVAEFKQLMGLAEDELLA